MFVYDHNHYDYIIIVRCIYKVLNENGVVLNASKLLHSDYVAHNHREDKSLMLPHYKISRWAFNTFECLSNKKILVMKKRSWVLLFDRWVRIWWFNSRLVYRHKKKRQRNMWSVRMKKNTCTVSLKMLSLSTNPDLGVLTGLNDVGWDRLILAVVT